MQKKELIKLVYIGRHGQRAPRLFPIECKQDWKGRDHLTNKGAIEQYKKGSEIRKKYENFLNSLKNSPSKIFVQSSNAERTLSSAYYLMNGILGMPFLDPEKATVKSKHEFLKVYGTKLRPRKFDVLFRGHNSDVSPSIDPIYKSLFEVYKKHGAHISKLKPYYPKACKVCRIEQNNNIDCSAFFYLYDFLHCYKENDMPFPKDFGDKEDYDSMNFVDYLYLYDLMIISPIVRRLTNHYMNKELITLMLKSESPSFHYYSSHDSNLFSLILGLGYNIMESPPLNSGLIIEIYKDSVGKWAHLEYNNRDISSKIWKGDSSGYIPLPEIIKLLEKESFADDSEFKEYSGNKTFDYARDYLNNVIEDSKLLFK